MHVPALGRLPSGTTTGQAGPSNDHSWLLTTSQTLGTDHPAGLAPSTPGATPLVGSRTGKSKADNFAN